MATRCCWPPERSSGNRSARSVSSTARSASSPTERALRRFQPSSSSGRVTFSRAVRAGMRLKSWNTNPKVRRRSAATPAGAIVDSHLPSTITSPLVGVVRPPAMVSRVDLPDPDAPMIATSSPACTSRSTPDSAVIAVSPLPYCIEMPSSWRRTSEVSTFGVSTDSTTGNSVIGGSLRLRPSPGGHVLAPRCSTATERRARRQMPAPAGPRSGPTNAPPPPPRR